MPLLDFRSTLADRVADGSKPCTIRRGARWREGMIAYCYTGVRTKHGRFLRASTVLRVRPIAITTSPRRQLRLDGQLLRGPALRDLARRDGFAGTDEFFAFFAAWHGPKFQGQLIEWDPATHFPPAKDAPRK